MSLSFARSPSASSCASLHLNCRRKGHTIDGAVSTRINPLLHQPIAPSSLRLPAQERVGPWVGQWSSGPRLALAYHIAYSPYALRLERSCRECICPHPQPRV